MKEVEGDFCTAGIKLVSNRLLSLFVEYVPGKLPTHYLCSSNSYNVEYMRKL